MKVLQLGSLENSLSKYSTWGQVAGYFDGDGTVGIDVQLFTLGLYLEFTDNWAEQLGAVEAFLSRSGISVYRPSTITRHGAYTLKILVTHSVVEAAKRMLPYVWKKELELKTTIDYYEGRITGQQVIEVFNEEVNAQKRVGKVRVVSLPHTYPQGRKMAQDFTLQRAVKAKIVEVPEKVRGDIAMEHFGSGTSQEKLAYKYQLSRAVIRRILRES